MGTERGTAEDESGRNVYINIDAKLENYGSLRKIIFSLLSYNNIMFVA